MKLPPTAFDASDLVTHGISGRAAQQRPFTLEEAYLEIAELRLALKNVLSCLGASIYDEQGPNQAARIIHAALHQEDVEAASPRDVPAFAVDDEFPF